VLVLQYFPADAGVLLIFSGWWATGFHRWPNQFLTELLCKKSFSLDGQTSWAKTSLQLVNLPSAQPLRNPCKWGTGMTQSWKKKKLEKTEKKLVLTNVGLSLIWQPAQYVQSVFYFSIV